MPRPVPAWAPARDLKGQPEPRYGLHATAQARTDQTLWRVDGSYAGSPLRPGLSVDQQAPCGCSRSRQFELALGHGGGGARTAVNESDVTAARTRVIHSAWHGLKVWSGTGSVASTRRARSAPLGPSPLRSAVPRSWNLAYGGPCHRTIWRHASRTSASRARSDQRGLGPERSEMNPSPHVAIIGAGIAGLSCAAALQQGGLEVSLFEKSRGPAGRMSTRRGDDWQCDHGAQYFTARHPAFVAELTRWIQAGVAQQWNPRLRVLGGASSRSPDPAVERFVGFPQMTAPARYMADALTVSPQTHVLELKRGQEGWQLRSAEHGWLTQSFDAVLVAVPAPQAVTLLEQPAPELAAFAGSATMRGCWALMLRFPAEVDLPFDAAFVNEGPLRWIARDSSKPGRCGPETWLLHASAEWSEEHLEAGPECCRS